jgi:hypothetical protein
MVRELTSLAAFPVENIVRPGTPDVSYLKGWVELKWLRAWPKREETPVRLDHWTQVQRLWHYRWRAKGGTSWVLLQCRHEWLLLDGALAALHLGSVNRKGLLELCAGYWDGVVWSEMALLLSSDLGKYEFTMKDLELLRG